MHSEFETYIVRVDNILRLIGMSIERKDSNRTLINRLIYHWKCSINLIFFNLSICSQIAWMVIGIVTRKSLLQITYLLPCVTLCLLGDLRLLSFIYYIDYINDINSRLKKLEATENLFDESTKKSYKIWLKFLTYIINMLVYLTLSGLFFFISAPFLIMGSYYYTSGEIKLILPFISWYPFDEFDIHFWPIAFIQQVQAGWMAIQSVVGIDCLFFACCTFIHLQFKVLQDELKKIVKENARNPEVSNGNDAFKQDFVVILNRHRELIRCVELLEFVYSKPTLFNVVTGSMIICATGFNLMAMDDYIYMVSFITFLIFGMVQVNLYCYYGDYVMSSSMQVGDAIYNSRWYDTRVTVRKSLFIVLLRSQKPCRFTASGFAGINLRTFTKILSTSWSYFALLNQMYQANSIE